MQIHKFTITIALIGFALFASLAMVEAAPLGDNSQCEPAGDWNQTDAYRSINGTPAGNDHECQYEYRSNSSGTAVSVAPVAHNNRSNQ